MKAMLIDDSRAMRMVLSRIVKRLGFEVTEAGDGREALDLIDDGYTPDVVLVDWNMPVMDGLTFINVVRARDDLRGITLMMVTTEGEPRQIIRALAAGAHEYMIKPFTADALVSKLELLGVLPNELSTRLTVELNRELGGVSC